MDAPTLTATEAVEQAGKTADQFLHQARRILDGHHPDAYQQPDQYPVLLAALVRAQAQDLQAACLLAGLCKVEEALESIAAAVQDLAAKE